MALSDDEKARLRAGFVKELEIQEYLAGLRVEAGLAEEGEGSQYTGALAAMQNDG